MTVELFCVLLLAFGTFSSIITEFIKSYLDSKEAVCDKYDKQLLSIIVGGITGIVGTFIAYGMNDISFSFMNVVYAILEGGCTIVGAQVGYDKLISVIKAAIKGQSK